MPVRARGDQWVPGEKKRYVDFGTCLSFFNEHKGRAICIAVCTWSPPGVVDNLVQKLARRRTNDSS